MNHNVRYIGRQLQQVCSLGLAGVIAAGLGLPVLVGAPPAQGGGGETVTGRANLHPIDDSGIKARIAFVDDGATLTVTGKATGLNPGESYITLIYDNGSVPSGPRACQPTIFDPTDPDFLLATMFVAFWAIHRFVGFFVFHRPDEGYEYVFTLMAISLALAIAGPVL